MEARARDGAPHEVDGEPLASLGRRQLLDEFHALYQERLHCLEVLEENQEEVLQAKVKLLQGYVLDLTDQNDILIQAVEELESRTIEPVKMAAVESDYQRPSLALRPMPAECLPGSTATPTVSFPPRQPREQEGLRSALTLKEQRTLEPGLHQPDATWQQERAGKELLEKDANAQELQETITDLHNKISRNDVGMAGQLQPKSLLETRLHSLQQETNISGATMARLCGLQLPSCRSCQPRKLELDAWEWKIRELQNQKREEREQKRRRILDLEESHQQAEGAMVQLVVAPTETVALRSKYRLALSEVVEQREALHGLWERDSHRQQPRAEQAGLVRQSEGQAQEPLERLQSAQEQVGVQDEAIAEPRGGLKAAAEAQAQGKDELAGKAAEGNGLRAQRHPRQAELKALQTSRQEQEASMVEQTRVPRQLQLDKEASLRQSLSPGALLEPLPGEGGSGCPARQAEREDLQERLEQLQQELDLCKERHRDHLLRLEAREGTWEREGLEATGRLLRQCQILKDQLFYYEEVTQKQEVALSCQREREQHLQECLGQAERKASLLEISLDLYRQKYQASLARGGELEDQLRRLQEELADQAREKEEAALKLHAEHVAGELARELREAQQELSQAQRLSGRCQETVQELQKQLASGHLELLEREEELAALRRDFATYKATHSCSNSSYENQLDYAEALRQKLAQAEEESAEHRRKAEEYQELLQDLKAELARVMEQETSARKGATQLERRVQTLQEEAAAQRERQQLAAAALEQQAKQLGLELEQSRQSWAEKEQEIQKRDQLLRRSQAKAAHAQRALQEKGQEAERHQAQAHRLAARLQEVQQELEKSRAEMAALRVEAEALREDLRTSQEQRQQVARELAEQEEQRLLAQSRLHSAQEQLEERVAEDAHRAQEGRRLEAEVQLLHERLSAAEAELEEKRDLLEQLTEALRESRQQHQDAKEEARQHQQAAARLERKLEGSRAGLQQLQQQVQGQESTLEALRAEASQQRRQEEAWQRERQQVQERESRLAREHQELQHQLESCRCRLQEEERKSHSLQTSLAEREAENRALQEQRKQHARELEALQANLGQAQRQLQQQTAQVLQQEAAASQLRSEFRAVQEREHQSQQTLSAAEAIARRLQEEVASCQASQREALGKLEQKTQETSCLQAELRLTQRTVARLEEELAGAQEQERQLVALQRERKQEACATKERLSHLSGQAWHWQKEHQAAKLALAEKEEELVVMKVELASLEEKGHRLTEEREELQNEVNLLRQKFIASSQEVESLQTSLEAARDDSYRLQHESELVVANVSQWVKEQKQVNEKLGHKIRDQIKQVAQLTGVRDHLHGLVERLQQENKQLKNEVDERRIECERLKALCSSDSDPPCSTGQPLWPTLPADELFPHLIFDSTLQFAQRRSQRGATKWHHS
ncbi:polyamine-modulated factor 1-binding protein 1 isoform X1 [Pogona vitticeps]